MNKTILYTTAFLVLAGIATFVLMRQNANTFGGKDYEFALKNSDNVYRVFIGDRDNNKVNLTKQTDGTWLVNDKYKARQGAIDLLFETATKLGIRDVIPEAALPSVYREFQEKGVWVRFYDEKGNIIKAYQIGDKTNDGLGTNIMMEGSEQPYIVHIPIWQGHITPRYMTLEKDWRDRAVFAIKPNAIESISVEYPNQRLHSFILTKKGGEFSIVPFYNTTPKITKPLNPAAAQQYFTKFATINAEAIKTDDFPMQTITGKRTPFSIVTVKKKDGTEQRVDFYPIPSKNTADAPISPSLPNGVPERYFAINGEELYLVQHLLFMEIFSAYAGFF